MNALSLKKTTAEKAIHTVGEPVFCLSMLKKWLFQNGAPTKGN